MRMYLSMHVVSVVHVHELAPYYGYILLTGYYAFHHVGTIG